MPDVTAAGIPVKLSSGEIVIVTPYNNRDMMSVLKLIQKKNLENLVAAIPKDLPTALYRASYAEAIKISKEFDINNIQTALQEVADEEILQTMLTLAIQKTYKGDASKKALQIMENVEDFNAIMGATGGQDKEIDESEIVKEGDDKDPPTSVQS